MLLAHSERAELATEERILSYILYIQSTEQFCLTHYSVDLAHTSDLEGFVVLRKNPDYMEEEKE